MAIRLDQLHPEVFEKINSDISKIEAFLKDYLDNKIDELNFVHGLSETTQVNKDKKIVKRNLEKSGFVELNRDLAPFRTAEQKEVGIWISNLETNESPFEPSTIDGQKRGISVNGDLINLTKGNIGFDYNKVTKLPIAPNLPVFYPENNDLVMVTNPSKLEIVNELVVDDTVFIQLTDRISDKFKINISETQLENGSVVHYYVLDNGDVVYLNNEGRSYYPDNPDELLKEKYNRYNVSFADKFVFEKIFDNNAIERYIDEENDSRLYQFVVPYTNDGDKIDLKYDNKKVYLFHDTDKRYEYDENGNLKQVEVEGEFLKQIEIKTLKSEDGYEYDKIEYNKVSDKYFDEIKSMIDMNNNQYQYIEDNGIKMFLNTEYITYYYPYRTYKLDENGEIVYETVTDENGNEQKVPVLIDDTRYIKVYSVGDKPNETTVEVEDNITGETISKELHYTEVKSLVYYRLYSVISDDTNKIARVDENGNYIDTPNLNRPLKINDTDELITITNGNVVVYSDGKPYYYHLDKGTKYYKREIDGQKYFVDLDGTLYMPDSDVEEIFKGIIHYKDIDVQEEKFIYNNKYYTFYKNNEGYREFVRNYSEKLVQQLNIDGYKLFKMINDEKQLVIAKTPNLLVKIDSKGNITNDTVTYDEVLPVLETNEVEKEVLNLNINVPFNIVLGDVHIFRNDNELHMYSDYEIDAVLSLKKSLEFNEDTKKGDTLYVKRVGKKDLVLRMEKRGTPENDIYGDWKNNTGPIVMPEYLTGVSYKFVDGEELQDGEQLKYNDVVKKDNRYYKYLGTPISYDDLPENDKSIHVDENSVLWQDITPTELEWERKGNNFIVFNLKKGEVVRFTVIRTIWEKNEDTGELVEKKQEPYVIEKTAMNDGDNLFVISDPNFDFSDPSLISYILILEKIDIFDYYENNRANNFKLTLTGLQTVAVNDDPALIYGEGYFVSNNVLKLKSAEINDLIKIERLQAPQNELKIEFVAEKEQPVVEVPFEIVRNKFDIVLPEVIEGREYTWIMGEYLPEGKALLDNDVVFDKENLRFYKYVGPVKTQKIVEDGVVKDVPVLKESLLRLSIPVQLDLIRQYKKLSLKLAEYPSSVVDIDYPLFLGEVIDLIVKEANELAKNDGLMSLSFYKDVDGYQVLNYNDEKVVYYFTKVREKYIQEITDKFGDEEVDALEEDIYIDIDTKDEIKRILDTDLPRFWLKKIKVNENGEPVLDENGNYIYYYEPTRKFWVEKNENGDFIERDKYGNEYVVNNKWEDITPEKVGYYRFGKTFTILDVKKDDEVEIRLNNSYVDEFSSVLKKVQEDGEFVINVDFNIEDENGDELPFEVIHYHINWIEGEDYIQEGQKLTLLMIEDVPQEVIIRRNDEFTLNDIVVLERKDLMFIEVWHEDVTDTGFIFPFGNVQYQGNEWNGIGTTDFDHVFYDNVNGEQIMIEDGNIKYCQVYQIDNVVYNYFDDNGVFESLSDEEKKFLKETFVEDRTLGKGWKISEMTDEERKQIFSCSDHNLYFDGDRLIQIRYRVRVVGLNLFNNYFKGNSQYLSEGLRFQGKSPITYRHIKKEVGVAELEGDAAGQPVIEYISERIGEQLIVSDNPNSILYKKGMLFDNALFVNENETDLSYNGVVCAIPVAIVHRRNQGVYHEKYNPNGTAFFINGIHVAEDVSDFADDISGFTLIDENGATLETASTGRDRKAKFKTMLRWLFNPKYKAGGSMASKTTYRPDGLLYDEISLDDVIDLRIDANDQRRRIEILEEATEKLNKNLLGLRNEMLLKFDETTNYINSTASLIYSHINEVEKSLRSDMTEADNELRDKIDVVAVGLSDLSSNVFTKDVMATLLVDTLMGLIEEQKSSAFNDDEKPTREEIEKMINAFVENMEGSYTKDEFNEFLSKVLVLVVDKKMLSPDSLETWIKELSIKIIGDSNNEIYSRNESLELMYEGLALASISRVLPPDGSDDVNNWVWRGKRYAGWIGSKHLDLEQDFLKPNKKPVAVKDVKTSELIHTYKDQYGNVWNKGYFPGPTIWGNVHNYHAIFTTWIFVEEPFKVEHVKLNGDDAHALYINKELVASNKYCCRDTDYSYDFSVPGWYRIDLVYTERYGGHYVQLGWNPIDYKDKIKYMTTYDMDELVELTKMRIEMWTTKEKSLMSTIVGDNSGYFTKYESKLIMIEGLKRIRNDILSKGTHVVESDIVEFNKTIEQWLDAGKFSDLGYEVKPEKLPDGTEIPRSDKFRPEPDLSGVYNKDEVVEIIRKGLIVVNGIDPVDKDEIIKWIDRLNVKINSDEVRYLTSNQIKAFLAKGLEQINGLDKLTNYEISTWVDEYVRSTFYDSYGNDLLVDNTADDSMGKIDFHELLKTELSKILGAQPTLS